MGTRTISLRDEAYERLRRARLHPSESFSDVVMRAGWERESLRAGTFLEIVRERGPIYSAQELNAVEDATKADTEPRDKWQPD